ncbi:MAG: hypothetical protein ACK5VX_00965, partial [Akkermansiaceae bacterium]
MLSDVLLGGKKQQEDTLKSALALPECSKRDLIPTSNSWLEISDFTKKCRAGCLTRESVHLFALFTLAVNKDSPPPS